MKKKSTILVAAVIAALAVGVAVLAVLNDRDAGEKREQLRDEYFVIHADVAECSTEYKVTMEEFLALGPVEFEANYKKSGKAPETRVYTGVPFAEVLRMKGIDPAQFSSASFMAADKYGQVLSMKDALDEENCFIAADDSGDGPFRMILPKDQFSQRWVKLLTDVHLR